MKSASWKDCVAYSHVGLLRAVLNASFVRAYRIISMHCLELSLSLYSVKTSFAHATCKELNSWYKDDYQCAGQPRMQAM